MLNMNEKKSLLTDTELADLEAKAKAVESVEDEIEIDEIESEDPNPTTYHVLPLSINAEMWEHMTATPQNKKFLEANEDFLNAATPAVVLQLIETVRTLTAKLARIECEAEWLAEKLAGEQTPEEWRKSAKKAVAREIGGI